MKLETETLRARVAEARDVSGRALLAERVSGGWWEGRLSSSALATATAVMALELAGCVPEKMLIGPGVEWLVRTQRGDGGWGDTPESLANLSTTLLVVAAYIWLEVLEWLRAEMLHHAAAQIDTRIAPAIFGKLFDAHLLRRGGLHASANQDWALLRSFMASPAMVAVLDAPFALVVVLILFFINPWLGFASICVAALLALESSRYVARALPPVAVVAPV
jgi:hypothetical protein